MRGFNCAAGANVKHLAGCDSGDKQKLRPDKEDSMPRPTTWRGPPAKYGYYKPNSKSGPAKKLFDPDEAAKPCECAEPETAGHKGRDC